MQPKVFTDIKTNLEKIISWACTNKKCSHINNSLSLLCLCVGNVCMRVCVVSVDQFSPKPNICGQGVGCNPTRVHIIAAAVIAIVAFVAFDRSLQ